MMIKNNLYKALFLSLSLTTLTLSSCQKSEDQTATSEVRTITFGISNVPQSDDALTRAADQRPDTIYKQLGNGIMMQTVITPQRQVLTRTNGDYMVDDGDKVLVIPVGSDGKVTSDPMTETVDGTKLTVKNLPSGTTRLVFFSYATSENPAAIQAAKGDLIANKSWTISKEQDIARAEAVLPTDGTTNVTVAFKHVFASMITLTVVDKIGLGGIQAMNGVTLTGTASSATLNSDGTSKDADANPSTSTIPNSMNFYVPNGSEKALDPLTFIPNPSITPKVKFITTIIPSITYGSDYETTLAHAFQPGYNYTALVTFVKGNSGGGSDPGGDPGEGGDNPNSGGVIFAYSNIFWTDAYGLCFYQDANTIVYNNGQTVKPSSVADNPPGFEGLYFRWASLVGMTDGSSNDGNVRDRAYIPTGTDTHTFSKTTMNGAFGSALNVDPETNVTGISHGGLAIGHYSAKIPYCHYTFDAGTDYNSAVMEGVTSDVTATNWVTAKYGNSATKAKDGGGNLTGWMGDVCAFLTNGTWRLPTASDFDDAENKWGTPSIPAGKWTKQDNYKTGFGDYDILKNAGWDGKGGTPAGSITLNNNNNADLKFPASDRRSYRPGWRGGGNDGYATNNVENEGTSGAYQTSSFFSGDALTGASYYSFGVNNQKGINHTRPTDAMPVRCVKN